MKLPNSRFLNLRAGFYAERPDFPDGRHIASRPDGRFHVPTPGKAALPL